MFSKLQHALEQHGHMVCNASDIAHLHEEHRDCSAFHMPFDPTQVGGYEIAMQVVQSFNLSEFDYKFSSYINLYTSRESARAPPTFTC